MCGIAGMVGEDADARVVQRMTDALSHRGPDKAGRFEDRGVALGHRRLKIVDLSARGDQPMRNEDGTAWVSFNGEVYNHAELRLELERLGHRFRSQCDTEAIVHGYEAWGERVVDRLRGDFAFAVWDAKKKRLFAARDRAGVKPFYYAVRDGTLCFASEIKALLQVPGVPRRVNARALDEYLSLRYSLAPRTLFDGIFKLPAGHALSFERGRVRTRAYWAFEPAPRPMAWGEAVERARRTFETAVERRLMSDVPLGAFLSGGLDSSYVVAVMSRLSASPVKTFSVSFNRASDETPFAREVADAFGTDHRELAVDVRPDVLPRVAWHNDEPLADVAAVPTYAMSEATKKHVTAVLTGDGGDEVFGGYPWHSVLPPVRRAAELAQHVPLAAQALAAAAGALGPEGKRLGAALASKTRADTFLAYAAAFSEAEKREVGSEPGRVPVSQAVAGAFSSRHDFRTQLLAFDVRHLLPNDYLMKVDRATMAWGLEARVPYLDEDMLSYAAQLPSAFKASAGRTKVLFRDVVRGTLPARVARRGKHGFNVPTKAWLQGEFGDVARQFLDEAAVRRGWNPAFVRRVVDGAAKRERFHARRFWALFGLELWHRVFLDREPSAEPASWKQLT